MSDRLTEKVIPENNEDGEELYCEQPHPTNSAHVNLPQLDILTVEKAQRMSEFLGFLADTNRLRILSILAAQEMCVGDLGVEPRSVRNSATSLGMPTLYSF